MLVVVVCKNNGNFSASSNLINFQRGTETMKKKNPLGFSCLIHILYVSLLVVLLFLILLNDANFLS